MSLITDWLLIIVSSMIAISSFKRILRDRYSSVAHFILLIEYIFMCTPILLNYCMGMPSYNSIIWYKAFLNSMTDDTIAIIYDLYILTSMALLYRYATFHDRVFAKNKRYVENKFDSFLTNRAFLNFVILLPIIQIIVSGELMSYMIYGTATARGIDNSDFKEYQSLFIQLSICAFCYKMFSTPVTKSKVFQLVLYGALISWISGKRFMIALLLLVYLFCLTRGGLERKTRRRLSFYIPVLSVGLVVFSYFYLVAVKPLSDTSFSSIYDMLRVDYGRDDVVKFVIERELFLDDPILDYRGQTILSEFFTFVPRFIWPDKPYPHYVYLTSEILGVARNKLPSGITPSWFELCIANFSWLGFMVGTIGIPLFCNWCDKTKSVFNQMLFLIFIMALITQSMTAYTAVLFLLMAKAGIKLILGNKKVVIVLRRRR